jgi:hypothetical protein
MRRSLLVIALAAWPAARLFAQPQAKRPRLKIPASKLLEGLSARFPLRFAVQGFMGLEVSAPALLLLTKRNTLGATLQLAAAGPALRERVSGEVDVLFGLRYEPSDRTVRTRDPEVHGLRARGVSPQTAGAIENVARALLSGMPAEVILHRFTVSELALPDTMGFEPGNLTILEDGLDIEFVPKRQQ